jgi:hypothetical protein
MVLMQARVVTKLLFLEPLTAHISEGCGKRCQVPPRLASWMVSK